MSARLAIADVEERARDARRFAELGDTEMAQSLIDQLNATIVAAIADGIENAREVATVACRARDAVASCDSPATRDTVPPSAA